MGDGRELYYEEKGSGPAVLLVPASGVTASTWGDFAEELSGHARVIAYDRRGYLRSGGEPGARSQSTPSMPLR
jgi:pimeloyl-ACP methyl ester carboxylesterase